MLCRSIVQGWSGNYWRTTFGSALAVPGHLLDPLSRPWIIWRMVHAIAKANNIGAYEYHLSIVPVGDQ